MALLFPPRQVFAIQCTQAQQQCVRHASDTENK